jgi:glucokinase
MAGLLVGVDIGGTKIATSAGDRDGRVIAHTRRPTHSQGEPRADVLAVAADVRAIVEQVGARLEDVATVGVSAPGPLDPSGRRLLAPPNLPGWDDVPLVEWLEEALDGRQVLLENDANAAALAEWHFGAGRGFHDVVYLTMSTGVGGGLILDDRLHRGFGRGAGEAGHMRVTWEADAEVCSCGRSGCLEAYVGGASWARRLRAITPAESAVAQLAGGVALITPEHVVAAAGQGDAFALSEMDRFNTYLARGIVNIGFLLAPQVVVLGTIAAAAGEDLCLAPVREIVERELWEVLADGLAILPAELGADLPARAGLGVALAG